MTTDTRAYVWCDLGTLHPGQPATIREDHIQGQGLCLVTGTITLAGIVRPAAGSPVNLAYSDGQNWIARFPRRLRVLSSSADPLRRETTLSVGCLLSYYSNRKPPVETLQETEQNASVPDVVRRAAALPITAAWVTQKILDALGLQAASSIPFDIKRVVDEWDLSAGYVEELGRIASSCGYFCRMDAQERVQFVSKDQEISIGPLIQREQIIDLTPMGVGDLPGEAVYSRYESTRLVAPDASLTEDQLSSRNWEREVVIGGPVQAIHSYTDSGGVLQKQFITYNDWSISETTYDSKDRVTRREQTANSLLGITKSVTTFDYGSSVSLPNTEGYDEQADSQVLSETTQDYGPKGDVEVACGKNAPWGSLNNATIQKSWRTTSYDRNPVAGITKTVTTQAVLYISTPHGSDAISRLREEGEPVEDLYGYASRLVSYGSSTRIRTERNFGLQKRPGQQERNRAALEKTPTVEQQTQTVWSYGSPASLTAIELSPPYTSDDSILAAGSPPSYSVVAGNAAQQAMRYGRIENRLLLANRNGSGLTLNLRDMPAEPFGLFHIRLNGCTGAFRTNGTTWTLGATGCRATTDALFWAAIDGTLADAWFPLPPGQASLPAAVAVTTNANPAPANAMAIPAGFDPLAPNLTALFAALPTNTPAVPLATVNPAVFIRPWRERIKAAAGIRVGAGATVRPWRRQTIQAAAGVRVGAQGRTVRIKAGTAAAVAATFPLDMLGGNVLTVGATQARATTFPLTLESGSSGPAFSLVTSRAALGGAGNQFINWGNAGGVNAQIVHPFNINTNTGTTVSVTMLYTNKFRRFVQVAVVPGDPLVLNGNFQGNFAIGDNLLSTHVFDSGENPISIVWPSGFAGAGTQIQAGQFGEFTARVVAYDAAGQALASFDVNGVSGQNPGTAVFIGIRSSSTPIFRVDFMLTSGIDKSLFIINQVDFTTVFA